jgi:ATP-dependent NAD(P)H-hydrate dehydratase
MNEYNNLNIDDNHLILTPNINEFERLYNKFVSNKFESTNYNLEVDGDIVFSFCDDVYKYFSKEIEMARKLNNKILVIKGPFDIITDGNIVYLVNNKGSLKRCGGIGDVLSGIIGSLAGMMKKNFDNINNNDLLEMCALSCYLCRELSCVSFNKYSYSLTTPDIIHELKNYTSIIKINL